MDFLLKMLESPPELTGAFQLALDVLILALLAVLLFGKKEKPAPNAHEMMHAFGSIIEQTQTISKEFEANLEQRQLLIQQITSKLDQRISEAQQLTAQLAEQTGAQPAQDGPAAEPAAPRGAGQKNILSLARKGLDAAQIALQLRKPVGEVELILSLHKIAS